jgi:signal transduction histidine kinase
MKRAIDPKPINVLILEDRPSDAELMLAQLRAAGFNLICQRVETERDFVACLHAGLDLILADYQLPQFDAIRALHLLHDTDLDIPFIIISGELGDDFIVEAMKQGAADFLLKDRMARLGTATIQALERKQMRTAQREGELALRRAVADAERNSIAIESVNRELAENNQRLSELYQTAQRFMDDVSHEFRTPLSVIKGYAEIMTARIAGPLSPQQMGFCQIIIDRTRDMAQMVDDLLDSSKLRAGSLRVDRKPCHVAAIFAAVRPMIDTRAAAGKIQCVEELEPGLPMVFADAEKVARVLVNLAINAIKFSAEQSRVVLSARATGHGDVEISVADDGPGISPENLAVIFDRFRQVGNSAGAKGFGLGLNIAKELVALNLGHMTVASELQKGSTFSFTLPVNDPEMVLARLLDRLEDQATPPGSFAVLRVTPNHVAPEAAQTGLRGFIASSSYPGDVIMSTPDHDSLILVGYSARPASWHRRLVKAAHEIAAFSPLQKLRGFDAELVDILPYPAALPDVVAMVLKHLQGETLHA